MFNYQIGLIDMKIVVGNLLDCNIHCVSNYKCQAFTIQRTDICKIQRFATSDDNYNTFSDSNEDDKTLILTRGTPIVSRIINKSLLTPKITTKNSVTESVSQSTTSSVTSMDPIMTSKDLTTENSVTESVSQSTTSSVTSMDPIMTSEDLTTENSVTESVSQSTTSSVTSMDPIMTSEDLTTETVMIITTPEPNPMPMLRHPTNTQFICRGMDDLDEKHYIFFWSASTSPSQFTVIKKTDIYTIIQRDDVVNVFEGFKDSTIAAVFSYDEFMHIYVKDNWSKYKVEIGSDGVILKATKQSGSITNSNWRNVMSATAFGNSSVIMRKSFPAELVCYNIATIHDSQIIKPPPNDECIQLLELIKNDWTLAQHTSLMGNDKRTIRLLNKDLYRLT
ncbi:hypothetical protein CHUAL_010503 [Chamberlinius hualienensis]